MAETGTGTNGERAGTDFRVSDPELFAQNMARAVEHATQAASAYLEPRQAGEAKASFAVDMGEITKTLTQVAEAWLTKPERAIDAQAELWRGYLDLWAFSMRRLAGLPADPVAEPEPKDWRFADPGWREHPTFDVIKQAYLVTARWAERMVADAEGIDDHTRHKAEFFMRQIVNAAAPSNFVPTNPELLRETLASNGANLVRGMQYLAEDIKRGRGDLKIRQTDLTRFEVGSNLATAPGKVVFQNELMQLIQYLPATETVARRPLLLVPPWINKFYILDLTPEKSMIRWLVDQGHTVFVISWVNPDERLADKSFEDYMRGGVFAALDAVREATGEPRANTVGYCVGGTLLSASLAHMAATGDDRVASASFLAAQADFTHAGDLKVFIDEPQLNTLETRMRERGYLEGREMAEAFNLMRSNDLIWPYVVGTYLKGKDPLPFDLLYWNSDATRMPAANHAFYLRRCYLNNDLSQGRMAFGDIKLDLKKVKVPIYSLATREDHIAPAKSVFLSARFYGSPVRFVLGGSGHIAGVVNHPSRGKYPHWVGGAPDGDLDEWIASAEERPGSWWPDWQAWLAEQNGDDRVAAREPGGSKLPIIEDAPGSYVKMKD